MSADAATLARRWAELWGVDPPAMAEEVYAPDVVIDHAGHGPRSRVEGRAALLEAERVLLEWIPDHANRIVRVVQEGDRAVVECVLSGTSAGDPARQACPACVWWDLDGDGRVAHEVAYWEWPKRRPDDDTAAGTLVAGPGRHRSASWYRERAARLAELWTADPLAMVDELYAEDCVMERLGEGPEGIVVGRAALAEAETALLDLLPRPQRRMDVLDVVAAGDVAAVAFTIEGAWGGRGGTRRGPGTLLLTFDGDDRIASDRVYWHWSLARPVPEPGARA